MGSSKVVREDQAVVSDTVNNRYCGMVSEIVESRRHDRGLKHAQADAASLLDITVRRVRAAMYREVRCVQASEWISVRNRFAAYLDAEAARLDAKAALIRARRNAMREDTV